MICQFCGQPDGHAGICAGWYASMRMAQAASLQQAHCKECGINLGDLSIRHAPECSIGGDGIRGIMNSVPNYAGIENAYQHREQIAPEGQYIVPRRPFRFRLRSAWRELVGR